MATTELRSAWAVAAAVTGPVKVRVARYLRDNGVFTSRPKWDKSGGLLSCVALGPTSHQLIKNDISCPLLCDDLNQDDSQIHLMSCQSVLSRLDTKYLQQVKETKYSDIFGDLVSQKAAVRHLAILLETRRKILEELQSTTASTSGPSLDTAPLACQGSSGDLLSTYN